MRRAIAIQGCLALVAAFTMAPFQHVHHGHDADHDHDHSSFIHTHFFNTVAEVEHDDSGPEIEDPHDQHSASPLDTFTVVPSAVFALTLPVQTAVVIPVPSASSATVEVVEERGHDPPVTGPSIPRAPPA